MNMSDGGITNTITVEIRAIARKSYIPIIAKERFDILIKMAEGFQALAEKGHPGALELTTDILNLLGEHFFTQGELALTKITDPTELLAMQSALLKSLKDETFYKKKLRDFTKRLTINLDSPALNATAKTKEIARKIRISNLFAKEQELKNDALDERMVILKQVQVIANKEKQSEKLKIEFKKFSRREQDKLISKFNEHLAIERQKKSTKIEILEEIIALNNQKELNDYLKSNPEAIAVINELKRHLATPTFAKIKEIARSTLSGIKAMPDTPSDIASITDLKLDKYKFLIKEQPFAENLKTIQILERMINFENKKQLLEKIKKEISSCKIEIEEIKGKIKKDAEAVRYAIKEARADDARARYDAVVQKFNAYFNKALEEKDINKHLDIHAMAFLTSVNNAIATVQGMDGTRKTLDMIIPFLWIKEKNPASQSTTISKIVKKMISDPISTEKSHLTELTIAIRRSALPDFEVEDEQASKESTQKNSSLYEKFSALQQNLSTLLKAVRGDFNDEFSLGEQNLRTLIKTSRNEITQITFDVFGKIYLNFKRLNDAGLIKSAEWKKQIEEMDRLSETINQLNEKQQLLLDKKKSEGNSLKLEKDLLELEEEKHHAFLAISDSIRKLTTLPVEKNNEHLLALTSVSRFVLSGIDNLDWYLDIISKGHQEYLENTDLYQNPFEAMTKISNEIAESQAQPQASLGVKEGVEAIKSKIQNFLHYSVGQFTRNQMAQRLMCLDQFGAKLEYAVQREKSHTDLISYSSETDHLTLEIEGDESAEYFRQEGSLKELTNNATKEATQIRTVIIDKLKALQTTQEQLEDQLKKRGQEKLQERSTQSYLNRFANVFYSTPLDTEIANLKRLLLENANQQEHVKNIKRQFSALKGVALNLKIDAETDLQKTSKNLYACYKSFKEQLGNPKTSQDLQALLGSNNQLYHSIAIWLANHQINSLYQELTIIQAKLQEKPNDANSFELLVDLLGKVKTLEKDIEENEVTNKPIDNMIRLKEILNKQIHKEIRKVCQSLNPENIHQKTAAQHRQLLKTGNEFLMVLKKIDPSLRSAQLNEDEVTLRRQIKRSKTFGNLGGHLSFSIEEFSTSKAHSTIKKLYQTKTTEVPMLLRKAQLYSRNDEMEFLQKIIDLLNKNKEHLSDTKKAAIFLGAINYLEEDLQAGRLTIGINNFKKTLNHMKESVFSELKKTSSTIYQQLEKEGADALQEFLKAHMIEFENNATANKVIEGNKSTLLHTTLQKRTHINFPPARPPADPHHHNTRH